MSFEVPVDIHVTLSKQKPIPTWAWRGVRGRGNDDTTSGTGGTEAREHEIIHEEWRS